jgi:hypothetical protein
MLQELANGAGAAAAALVEAYIRAIDTRMGLLPQADTTQADADVAAAKGAANEAIAAIPDGGGPALRGGYRKSRKRRKVKRKSRNYRR